MTKSLRNDVCIFNYIDGKPWTLIFEIGSPIYYLLSLLLVWLLLLLMFVVDFGLIQINVCASLACLFLISLFYVVCLLSTDDLASPTSLHYQSAHAQKTKAWSCLSILQGDDLKII